MRKLKGSLLSLYFMELIISRGIGKFDDDLHGIQKWAHWNLLPQLNIYFLSPTEARLSQARSNNPDKRWEDMVLSEHAALPFQLWAHDCGGFPQISLQLPWFGFEKSLGMPPLWGIIVVWWCWQVTYLSVFLAMHSQFIVHCKKNNPGVGCLLHPFLPFLEHQT